MSDWAIRFCTSADGTRIAYAVSPEGSRQPAVIELGYWLLPFDMGGTDSDVIATRNVLAEDRRTVRIERRGVGHSGRNVTDVSFLAQIADVSAVADHFGAPRFDLLGFADGALIAAAYAARNPSRVRRLCLATAHQYGPPELWSAVGALIRASWGLGRRTLADLALGEVERDVRTQWVDRIARQVNQEVAALYADELSRLVVPDGLERIAAETMVLHAGKDFGGSAEMARALAAALPRAHLVATAHRPGVKEVAEIIQRFFNEPDESVADAVMAAHGVQTILFTDIEHSTELTQRLGDRAAQELVRAHNTAVRTALAQHGGTEIKHTGDGIMAAFATASAGVECAIAIQRTLADAANDAARLRVRVGLNAGEPVTEERDLFGTAVQLARRICDAAQASEILVSNVVRELCAGKNFRFADRGVAALKGFAEPVQTFAVPWEG